MGVQVEEVIYIHPRGCVCTDHLRPLAGVSMQGKMGISQRCPAGFFILLLGEKALTFLVPPGVSLLFFFRTFAFAAHLLGFSFPFSGSWPNRGRDAEWRGVGKSHPLLSVPA